MAPTFNWKELLPNFTPNELLSPDTIMHPHLIEPQSARLLQMFRQAIDKPFLVNYDGHLRRGVRSAKEEIALQDELRRQGTIPAENSMHITGRAWDITVKGLTVNELAEKAKKFGWGGIGIYPTFTHLDNRRTKDGKPVIWVMK